MALLKALCWALIFILQIRHLFINILPDISFFLYRCLPQFHFPSCKDVGTLVNNQFALTMTEKESNYHHYNIDIIKQ